MLISVFENTGMKPTVCELHTVYVETVLYDFFDS